VLAFRDRERTNSVEVKMSTKGPFDPDFIDGLLFGNKPKAFLEPLEAQGGTTIPTSSQLPTILANLMKPIEWPTPPAESAGIVPVPFLRSLSRGDPMAPPPFPSPGIAGPFAPSLPWLTPRPKATPPVLGAEHCKNLVASLLRRQPTVGLGRVLPNLDTLAVMEGREIEAAFVYTDLASFTKIVATQPTKASFVMLQAFVELVGRITNHYGGAVVDCAGDRLLSVFHRPAKDFSWQPVQQAITAAFWTQAMLAATTSVFLGYGVSAAQVGIGIDYGSVVAGCVGFRNNKRLFFLGDAANNAAKLQDLAGAGETVISYAAFLRKPKYMENWIGSWESDPGCGSIFRVRAYFSKIDAPPKPD
jgi:class 3 adenylate cyclase